jgi:hypothetical protein
MAVRRATNSSRSAIGTIVVSVRIAVIVLIAATVMQGSVIVAMDGAIVVGVAAGRAKKMGVAAAEMVVVVVVVAEVVAEVAALVAANVSKRRSSRFKSRRRARPAGGSTRRAMRGSFAAQRAVISPRRAMRTCRRTSCDSSSFASQI